MVTTTAIYSREQLGISRTLLGGAISSACHPCREIHLLSADSLRSPQKLCMLGRGRHWGHLVSELGGFELEVLDLALAVLKLVEGRSLVHVFHPVAQDAVDQAGELGRHRLDGDGSP